MSHDPREASPSDSRAEPASMSWPRFLEFVRGAPKAKSGRSGLEALSWERFLEHVKGKQQG